MKEVIRLMGIGMVLGVSNVIPGVSGGTMAVVFGIYDTLISVITLNLKKLFSMWKFWLPLGIGIGVGILGFSSAIMYLFDAYPIPTNWFFVGLIVGSIPLIYGKITSSMGEKTTAKITSVVISMLVMFTLMVAMKLLENQTFSSIVHTEITFSLFITLTISAALAAIAMIIPGISGSFLLLVLGSYTTIIGAISDLNIPLLIPVALGVPLGLLGGAKLVRLLMEKVPSQTYGAILGLIFGSVFVIFPGFTFSVELLFSILSFTLGFALAYLSSKNKE